MRNIRIGKQKEVGGFQFDDVHVCIRDIWKD